jgi:hypothetical protein
MGSGRFSTKTGVEDAACGTGVDFLRYKPVRTAMRVIAPYSSNQ